MATITSLQTSDTGAESLSIINTNFTNLNTDKLEKSGGTLTGAIGFTGTTHAGLKANTLTTTQRDALTPANGMIIYNSTTGQIEKYENGSWVGTTGVANASATVAGIAEIAVQSEIDNDTATGGTGAAIAITPDQLALSKYGTGIPSSDQKAALAGTSGTPSSTNKYVTNDDTATAATANKVARRLAGGNITVVTESAGNNSTNAASTAYVDAGAVSYKNGTTTRDNTAASGTVNIAHGLGKIPKYVRFTMQVSTAGGTYISYGVYNATTQSCIYGITNGSLAATSSYVIYSKEGGNEQKASVTFDATNLIVVWTKVSTPAAGTQNILWEVFG